MADLDALLDEYLRCRTYGHAWDEFNPQPDEFSLLGSGWHLYLRCTRCGTKRVDAVLRIGMLDARRYVYEDGYKLAEKVDRVGFRKELYRRRNKKNGR